MDRAVVYCRASRDNFVLAADVERGEAFVRDNGLQLVEVIKDTRLESIFERKGIKRIIELAKAGDIDIVVATNLYTFVGYPKRQDLAYDLRDLTDQLTELRVAIVFVE